MVHEIARVGFGEGTNELYDRARPSYQPPALKYIRDSVVLPPPLNIVEIGAGTGLFTRALLAHPDWSETTTIGSLKAYDPSSGMRAVFTEKTRDDRVTVAEGTFERIDVEDSWADLIVVAQAFHWCPDYEKAAQEFARVLKPQGTLAYIWNLEDRHGVTWVARTRDVIEAQEAGTPQFRLGLWRQFFNTPSYRKFFKTAEEMKWKYVLPVTIEDVVTRSLSKSYISILPEDERDKVVDNLRNILETEQKTWINNEEGVFEYPYETTVVIIHRR
ncbi:S-adenosyl-L-methionine-dependent methyltransferase [Thelephora ganbajun]|uniref:S-adenosyl-L-methionine-dependent methyltransferase n=1 Tax=Thelephora ganbajun TaxID=370292 RepID=A0ACB6ZDX8_THEGA|nr:S-adenosyl-L-methionine-dependent methyltransferase [Thelephora ganbajun]